MKCVSLLLCLIKPVDKYFSYYNEKKLKPNAAENWSQKGGKIAGETL